MPDAHQSSHDDTATVDLPKPTEADVQALEEKLQRLSVDLPPGERNAFGRLMALAAAGNEVAEAQAADDVKGHGFFDSLMPRAPVYRASVNRVNLSSFRTVFYACGAGICGGKKIGGFSL